MPDKFKNYIGFDGAVEKVVESRTLTRMLHGPDEFSHQNRAKIIMLNELLENLMGFELLHDEYCKAASIAFDQTKPIFTLKSKEGDLAKIKRTISDFHRVIGELNKAAAILKQLPKPADLHLLASYQRIIAERELVEDQLEFYETMLSEVLEAGSRRALFVAKVIRIAFERYTRETLTVSKDAEGPTSHFAYSVKTVFDALELGGGYFECAREALKCDTEDPDFKDISQKIKSNNYHQTDNAYEFCATSLTYMQVTR